MSITTVHHASMIVQKQSDSPAGGPLYAKIAAVTNKPAIGNGTGSQLPNLKSELDSYGATDLHPNANAWTATQWIVVGSNAYKWDGTKWVVAPLATNIGTVAADEYPFTGGRWPRTLNELKKITPTPADAFEPDEFVSLEGLAVGSKYHWDGEAWVAGVAPEPPEPEEP